MPPEIFQLFINRGSRTPINKFFMVKIRLQRFGKKGKPYFKIVAANVESKRDGRFIELLGNYNPNSNPASVQLNIDRAVYWLEIGAQPTDTARSILSREGALMKKHLNGGVKKGAFTQEEADARFAKWLEERNKKVSAAKESLSKAQKEAKEKALKAEKEANEKKKAEIAAKNAPAEAPAEEEAAESAPEAEAPKAEE